MKNSRWIFWFLLAAPLYAESFLAQQAQLAWQERDKPGQTEQAFQTWQEAYRADPTDTKLLINLTRAAGRAYRRSTNSKDKKHWADLARDYGARAIAKNPASSMAYAEYGAALGQWADCHRGVGTLKIVRQAVDVLKKSISLDPENAFAHMLLGEFYRESPRTLSVGDRAEALKEGNLAVKYGPQMAITHLSLGKTLLLLGKHDEAIQELQNAATLTAPPDAVPETLADQESARALLSTLGADCKDSAGAICHD